MQSFYPQYSDPNFNYSEKKEKSSMKSRIIQAIVDVIIFKLYYWDILKAFKLITEILIGILISIQLLESLF
jgi:hypothetical protein